jgi:hypothetical protein
MSLTTKIIGLVRSVFGLRQSAGGVTVTGPTLSLGDGTANFTLTTTGPTSGAGNSLTVKASDAASGNTDGGNLVLAVGAKSGSGLDGSVTFKEATAAPGTAAMWQNTTSADVVNAKLFHVGGASNMELRLWASGLGGSIDANGACFGQNSNFGTYVGCLHNISTGIAIVSNVLRPTTGVGTAVTDNTLDLGASAARFKNLFLGTQLVWGTGSADDTGLKRLAAGVLSPTDGASGNGWFQQTPGRARCTTQLDATTNTTLADVTGLSVTLKAGRKYTLRAKLFTTSTANGGVKIGLGGTCTVTSLIAEVKGWSGTTLNLSAQATALGSLGGANVATDSAEIGVDIVVNAAGTLTIQAAQNTSHADTTSVKVGSFMIVEDMP